LARQLGCSTAAIRRWQTEMSPLDPEVAQRMSLGEDENKRLRKENARLKMENEILKKATAYFASDTL
jgi:transposase-like protein